MTTRHATSDAAAAKAEAHTASGYLSEMFCSIQGEGPFVGERQVFVRTAGCTATCSWCDTVYSKMRTPRFVIHDDAARRKRTLDNPLPAAGAAGEVLAFAARHHPVHTVSLTGGEPLEQPEFARELAERVHAAGLRVYLETNGIHADAFLAMARHVDVVAMDVKLPSALGVEAWDEHRRFLYAVASRGTRRNGGTRAFVKVVVDDRSTLEELDVAAGLVAGADPSIELILQPESGVLFGKDGARARRMLDTVEAAHRSASASLERVRVMPQLHKVLRVR